MKRSAGLVVPAALFALGLCVLAPAASGQEAIATATTTADRDAPAPPSSEPLQIRPHLDGAEDIVRAPGPCGGFRDPDTGKVEKTPHGEVHAGVGTGGYREAGGTVCVPLSDNVSATVAVDAGHYGWRRPR
ncbi:MAG TPA: hypothetical protein VG248_10575 [Caulobacteraceae bacterium]|nr:hypothetical protein [Caulobacteraceae bacterium]